MSTITAKGNLAATPIFRSGTGQSTLSFRLIENRSKSGTDGGQRQELTPNVHDLKLVGKLAEMFKDKFQKGMMILATGSVAPNNYTKEDGTNATGTTIFIDDVAIIPFNCIVNYTPTQRP